MTTDDHTWLTVPEAARELRVSVPTVWRWIRAGRLAASRIGARSVRIRREDLAASSVATVRAPKRDGEMLEDEYGPYIDLGDHTLTGDELLALLRTHREAMLARRGGIPLPDSAQAIRDMREMRFEDL
jgi:excisionase family DNA binding protein